MNTDAQFRDRWLDYYLSDGRQYSSREIYWRLIEWEKVVKIRVNLRGLKYDIESGPDTLGFMNFRWAGSEAKHDSEGKPVGRRPIHTWVVGTIEPNGVHLSEFDFKTGQLIKRSIEPIEKYSSHIHPRLENVSTN